MIFKWHENGEEENEMIQISLLCVRSHNSSTNYIRFFFSLVGALFYEFLNEKLKKYKSY